MFGAYRLPTQQSLGVRCAELVRALWKRKWIVIGAFICSITVISLACLTIQPQFEASALLVVRHANPDGPQDDLRRTSEINLSLVEIARSDDVLREAAEEVGVDRLVPPRISLTQKLRDAPIIGRLLSLLKKPNGTRSEGTAVDRAPDELNKALAVKLEPNSDIIRISFQHADPAIAAAFVNAVAQTFVDKQLDLFRQPGAATFYQRQKEKFDDDVRKASADLVTFVAANGIYSAHDQIELLLRRSSDLSALLATTRGLIADKKGRKEALVSQMRRLRPGAQTSFVSSLADAMGSDDHAEKSGGNAVPRALSPSDEHRTSDTPPLAMVRIYQETIDALFKADTELQGLTNLEIEQAAEIARLNSELDRLSASNAEFNKLERAVAQASLNADAYAKRMVEEQISSESVTAKFSIVKIVQGAYAPISPSFPNYTLLIGLSVCLSLVIGGLAGLWPTLFSPSGEVFALMSLPENPAPPSLDYRRPPRRRRRQRRLQFHKAQTTTAQPP
jgi:uncharacterized protein involved in exopolysaccharide biosynthesis